MEIDLTEIIVLILNYNSADLTKKCVESLLRLYKKIDILVVDNNSSDNSFQEIGTAFKQIINFNIIANNSNQGYACGNNYGFRYIKEHYSSKKYVLVMNPDVTISSTSTIPILMDFLSIHDEYSIVSTQIIYNNSSKELSECGWKFPSNLYLFLSGTFLGKILLNNVNNVYSAAEVMPNAKYMPVDVVTGCFFMARINDLSKVDYFDERTFLYFEETILASKLRIINKKEAILLNHFVNHNHYTKDKQLVNYRKRLFDRKCYHDSKMIFVNNYTDLKGLHLIVCNCVNNIDFLLKKLIYGLLSLTNNNYEI